MRRYSPALPRTSFSDGPCLSDDQMLADAEYVSGKCGVTTSGRGYGEAAEVPPRAVDPPRDVDPAAAAAAPVRLVLVLVWRVLFAAVVRLPGEGALCARGRHARPRWLRQRRHARCITTAAWVIQCSEEGEGERGGGVRGRRGKKRKRERKGRTVRGTRGEETKQRKETERGRERERGGRGEEKDEEGERRRRG